MQYSNIISISIFLALAASKNVFAEDANTWQAKGQAALEASEQLKPNNNRAKNVILFVGDGMGISTITAARIFEGQRRGVDGESNSLSFRRFLFC